MPKLRPPPPWLAQCRSAWCAAVGLEHARVGGDDRERLDRVGGQAVAAREHAVAAAEREPRDADASGSCRPARARPAAATPL